MKKMSAVSMLLLLGVGMLGCNAAKQAAPPQQPPPPTLTIAGNWTVTVSNAVCPTSDTYGAIGILNTCITGAKVGSFNGYLQPFSINVSPNYCQIPFPNSPWNVFLVAGASQSNNCALANLGGYGSIGGVSGDFPAAPWGAMLTQGPTIDSSPYGGGELAVVLGNADLWVFGGEYLYTNGQWTFQGVVGPCANVGINLLEWPSPTLDCSGATYPTVVVSAVYVGPDPNNGD
jgi:hypothetical protein